jgi:hypothetical protein
MKKHFLPITAIFFVLAMPLGCARTKLNEYKATSVDEQEIIQVMTRAQDAWNKADENGFIAEFCPNAEYAYRGFASNRGQKEIISKAEISKRFSIIQNNMGTYDLENAKLSITGDKADFTAENAAHSSRWRNDVIIRQENEKWCIADWDFNFHY